MVIMRIYSIVRKKIFIGILCLLLVAAAGCGRRAQEGASAQSAASSSAAAVADTAQAETDQGASAQEETAAPDEAAAAAPDEHGSYTSAEDVALYLHTYGRLPDNFITKQEARELGWEAEKGNLHEVAPGMSIGGDRFGNREGLLPDAPGRTWYECDINYAGGRRGAERIVFSNDGLIFYTGDHYASYEQLYP